MDRNEASALADLQMHWDEAYAIGFDGDVWSARFHGCTDELCARTSSDLRELIRADYVHRQRPHRPQRPAPPNGAAQAGDGQSCDGQADDAQADDGQAGDGQAGEAQGGEDDGHAADDAAPAPGGSAEAASDVVQSDCVSDRAAEPLGRVDFASIRGERMST